MHFNIVETLISKMVTWFVEDRSISSWSNAHNSLIIWYILIKVCIPGPIHFKHHLDAGMQNDDKALLNISLAVYGHLVKILITLEPDGVFSLNYATRCIRYTK